MPYGVDSTCECHCLFRLGRVGASSDFGMSSLQQNNKVIGLRLLQKSWAAHCLQLVLRNGASKVDRILIQSYLAIARQNNFRTLMLAEE